MSTKVEKMLSPEEEIIVSNIESLVMQLKQMNPGNLGETAIESNEVMMAKEENKKEEEKKEEDDKKEKSIETTQSEGAVANDDAEERIDETQTEQSEEALQEVVKTLLNAMNKKQQPVKKSANTLLLEAVKELVEVQKASNAEIDVLRKGMGNILEATGIVKQFELAEKSKSTEQVAKSVNNENEQFINQLKQMFNGGQVAKSEDENKYITQGQKINKNMQAALKSGWFVEK